MNEGDTLTPRYWGTPGFNHRLHDHTLGGECADSPPLLLRDKKRKQMQDRFFLGLSHCLVCGMPLREDFTHDREWGEHN